MFAIVVAFFNAPGFAEDATNVTSVVAAAVKDNKLSINASNETFRRRFTSAIGPTAA